MSTSARPSSDREERVARCVLVETNEDGPRRHEMEPVGQQALDRSHAEWADAESFHVAVAEQVSKLRCRCPLRFGPHRREEPDGLG